MRGLRDDVIAGAHMGEDRRGNRRHAGADGDRALRLLQLGDDGLDMRNVG